MALKRAKPGAKPGFAELDEALRSKSVRIRIVEQLSPDVLIRIRADDTTLGGHDIGRPREQLLMGALQVLGRGIIRDRRLMAGGRSEGR